MTRREAYRLSTGKLVDLLRADGFSIIVADDGEDFILLQDNDPASDIVEFCSAVDEAKLKVVHPSVANSKGRMVLILIYGNHPAELVADCSDVEVLQTTLDKYESWGWETFKAWE